MSNTYSYKKLVYRIRHKDKGTFGLYEGNEKLGTFEFISEENARKYVKEQNLQDVFIDEVLISTTEDIRTL